MTTFDLWPIPWGGGGIGWRDKYVTSWPQLAMNHFVPLLATHFPTLWIHTSGGAIDVEHSTYICKCRLSMPSGALPTSGTYDSLRICFLTHLARQQPIWKINDDSYCVGIYFRSLRTFFFLSKKTTFRTVLRQNYAFVICGLIMNICGLGIGGLKNFFHWRNKPKNLKICDLRT